MIASSMLVAEFFYKFVDYKVITKGLDLSVLRWCLILSVLGSSFALTFFSTSDKVVSSIKVDSSYPIKEKPRVIALGDSHLPHAKLFLDKLAVPVNYVSVNCLPIPDTTHIYAATSFSQKNNKCIKQNSMWDDKYSTYDVVLLAARWSHPFIGRIDEKRVLNQWSYETRLVRANDYAPKSTTLEDSKVIFETEMDSLSAKIAERGKRLVLFGEVPPLGATPTGCERLNNIFVQFCSRHYFKREEALQKLSYTSQVFFKLSQKYHGNVIYIDVSNSFCPQSQTSCLQRIEDVFLYNDDNHLNYKVLKDNKEFFSQTKSVLTTLTHIFDE